MQLPKVKTPPKQTHQDLSILLYGPGKFGKSTWASQAEDALFLATEPGLGSLEVFQIPIKTWEDLLSACAEIAKGNHNFKTIIIDTIDNAFRMCADYICAKNKVDHESDLAFGKGYALVSNEFQRVLTKLAGMDHGLFLISHSQEKEVEMRTGKVTRSFPTLPGKARKKVMGMVDMILFGDLESPQGQEGQTTPQRVLRTKPSLRYEAGDRTGRLPDTIPLNYASFLEAFNQEPSKKRNRRKTT